MIDFSLKLEALAWFRYGRRWPYVATEVGYFNADVLASDGKKLVEIEVKKTKADFANDFKNKSYKHMVYSAPGEIPRSWVPNQLYFFVPAKLREEALKLLDENKSPAGLVVLVKPLEGLMWSPRQRHVEVVRKPKDLHSKPVPAKVLEKLVHRMASDLITTKLKLENLARDGTVTGEVLLNLEDALKTLMKTPDWENADETKLEQVPPHAGDRQGQDDDPGRPGSVREPGAALPEIQPPPNCS